MRHESYPHLVVVWTPVVSRRCLAAAFRSNDEPLEILRVDDCLLNYVADSPVRGTVNHGSQETGIFQRMDCPGDVGVSY